MKAQSRKANIASADVPSIVHDVLSSSGQPLDAGTRAYMEPRFGHDFSQVRIHADARAAESAKSVNALAYTVGRNMIFGQGQYAPKTDSGRRLLAHELTHTLQQREKTHISSNRTLEAGSSDDGCEVGDVSHANVTAVNAVDSAMIQQPGAGMRLQCNDDRAALTARLRQVRARLAQLRGQEGRLTGDYMGSLDQERQRESLERFSREFQAQSRSARAERSLWGGQFAGARIRRAATASQSGNTVTVAVNIQLTYLALSDADARVRAAADIPRIETAIRDVWQVDITSGEYAGISFRMRPTVTYLPQGTARSENAFWIQVRGPDSGPSSGEPVPGIISLAQAHLDGPRVIVVAHELAHLFGFIDAYLTISRQGPNGQTIEEWAVGRTDAANRPDLLGMIDPVVLARLQRQGSVTAQDVARQTRPVHVWEEEANLVLGTLRVAPPAPARPTPDSEDFDPEVELDRVRREGEARLAPIRERRRRVENSMEWLNTVEEIMRLESEERELVRRLGLPSSP